MLKTGVDTYSFHRFLGEVYPIQEAPGEKMTYIDVLKRCYRYDIQGLCVETCFLDVSTEKEIDELQRTLQSFSGEIILAWGHPLGLEGGNSDEALQDLENMIDLSSRLSINLMRIVGSNRRLMTEPKESQIDKISGKLKELMPRAEQQGVRLAIENHLDFTAEDILQILEKTGTRNLGVTFDTGNALRIGEDPLSAAKKLSGHIFATHIKDVFPIYGGDPSFWAFFACVPFGKGIINIPKIIETIETGGYKGFYAVEVDYLHPNYTDEFEAVDESLSYLRKL